LQGFCTYLSLVRRYSIAITYALLDPIMTVFRPIAAFVTALAAGITNNLLIKDVKPISPEEAGSCTCSTCSTLSEDPGFAERIYAGIRYAYLDLLGEIAVCRFDAPGDDVCDVSRDARVYLKRS